jgi:hypothetical protein
MILLTGRRFALVRTPCRQNLELLDITYNAYQLGNSTTDEAVNVQYTPICAQYLKNSDGKTALDQYNHTVTYSSYVAYSVDDYNLGNNVVCTVEGMFDFGLTSKHLL